MMERLQARKLASLMRASTSAASDVPVKAMAIAAPLTQSGKMSPASDKVPKNTTRWICASVCDAPLVATMVFRSSVGFWKKASSALPATPGSSWTIITTAPQNTAPPRLRTSGRQRSGMRSMRKGVSPIAM
jgi:hypothetical protein